MRAISILFLSILPILTQSQDFTVGLQTGLGSYRMTDLKKISIDWSGSLPFENKLVHNHPPFLYYQPEFKIKFNKIDIGLLYSIQSTGSRVSSKDYSGEYRFDSKINSLSAATTVCYRAFSFVKEQIGFVVYNEVGMVYSTLEFSEYLNLLNTVFADETQSFKSLNYYCEPGFGFDYKIRMLSIGFNAGYLYQFGKKGFKQGSNQVYNSSGDVLKPDWSGFRAGISVHYNFSL